MATVQQVINRSLRMLGVLATGQTPTADETADALTAINAMLDGWRNDNLMVYSLSQITVPLVSTQSAYLIGQSGSEDVTAVAPVSIDSAVLTVGNVDYHIALVDDKAWFGILDKATNTSTVATTLWFNATHPDVTINVYPTPSASQTLKLNVWTPYTAFAAASDTFSMPNGYEEAVTFNLAVLLAPEYPSVPLSPIVVEKARSTLASIKRLNRRPQKQVTQLAGLFNRGANDIYAG